MSSEISRRLIRSQLSGMGRNHDQRRRQISRCIRRRVLGIDQPSRRGRPETAMRQQKQRKQPGDIPCQEPPSILQGQCVSALETARAGTPRSTDDRADRSCQGLFLSIVSGRQQGKASWPVIRPRRTFTRRRIVDRWVVIFGSLA